MTTASFESTLDLRATAMVALLATALAAGTGCDETAAGQTAPPPTDSLAAELCPGACAAVKTCYDAVELTACEPQCALELAGGGYLSRETAGKYLQILRDEGQDPDCHYTNMAMWDLNVLDSASYVPPVDDWNALEECIAHVTSCSTAPPGYAEEGCFKSFYRFNEATRDAVRACFLVSCSEYGDCVCAAQPSSGRPWVAIPPRPPNPANPEDDYRCPPVE